MEAKLGIRAFLQGSKQNLFIQQYRSRSVGVNKRRCEPMGGLCCCDHRRAELEEELIDGGKEGSELGSIARKEGFVLVKEPGTGGGTSWPKHYLQASGGSLHFFKDATLKHLKTSVDLRQIAVAQDGTDGVDGKPQVVVSLTAAGQELLRFRAVEGAAETKEWLECIEEMQLDAQSSDALYQPAASPSSRAAGVSPEQGGGTTVVIGTDSITECDYNEL